MNLIVFIISIEFNIITIDLHCLSIFFIILVIYDTRLNDVYPLFVLSTIEFFFVQPFVYLGNMKIRSYL